jgi:hypothetical protein
MSAQIITQGWGAGLGISITVALPPFPNVPALPGVPQLARSLLFPAAEPPAIGTPATSGALWQSTMAAPVWGLFDSDGNLVVEPDSIMDFGWRKENRVPNFPVQAGQFATYNRVGLPFESSVTFTKGGDESSRTLFLQQIDAVIEQSNIELYTIRTPEKSYINVTATRAELSRRGAGNAFYFDVELYFTEVNQVDVQYSTVATPTSNASVPSAVPPANQGLSNPQTPTTAVQQSALAAITPPVPVG